MSTNNSLLVALVAGAALGGTFFLAARILGPLRRRKQFERRYGDGNGGQVARLVAMGQA